MVPEKSNLQQVEEIKKEIAKVIRRTKGIIKIDPMLGKKMAESDELSSLEC